MRARRLLPALGLLLAACERHPLNRLTDPAPEQSAPAASADWLLYGDELRTGGGFFLIPGDGEQSLKDGDDTASVFGSKCLRYSWTGAAVSGQHLFAGFGLLVAPNTVKDPSTPPRDLSGAGFTRISFWARGTLSENTFLRVEGPVDGTGSTLAPTIEIPGGSLAAGWARYTLAAPPAAFASVKQYVNFILVYSQPSGTTAAGQGGTVQLDQVSYER